MFKRKGESVKIELGSGPGGPFSVDLTNLLETRLLIQANSGAGKSWAVRKLLEESHGKVQQIILDRDGEFVTLREKFDYIVAGVGGDIPAVPRHADVLARKILELGASMIVDLSELKPDQRQLFVKNFLEAMVNAPKKLWHSVLVLVDEAHVFCPQKTQSLSTGAVIEMASLGRKRGFCQVLATQRIAKLNKDAAAECTNKMIGRTPFVDDAKRAVEELGFPTKDFMILRTLKPGEFFVFGPSISDEVIKVKTGPVKSRHPKSGQRIGVVAKAAKGKIKSVLAKLADLPQQAETETRTLEEAKAKIRKLEANTKKLERDLRSVPVKADEKAVERAYQKGLAESRSVADNYKRIFTKAVTLGKVVAAALNKVMDLLQDEAGKPAAKPPQIELPRSPLAPPPRPPQQPLNGDAKLGRPERAILGFLLSYPGKEFSKIQVSIMSGYSVTSSSFSNAVGRLNTLDLIERRGRKMVATQAAESLEGIEPTAVGLERWTDRLGRCEKAIFLALMDRVGEETSREEAAEAAQYSINSSSFSNAVGKLRSLGLIIRNGNGSLAVNPEISEL